MMYFLQENYDQLIYEHLKLKKMKVNIDHSQKEKDKDHLDLSSRLLNVTFEREVSIEDIKLRLDNHIKSLHIILFDHEKYFTCIIEFKRSIQYEELKRSYVPILDTNFDKLNIIIQLEY